MAENIRERTQEAVSAAREGRIPDEARKTVQETVAKGRAAYNQLNEAATDGFSNMEHAFAASFDNIKTMNGKILQNFASNTEAVFDAAQAMASAKSIPEAAQIYARFMQEQFTNVGRQTQEFFELSTNSVKSSVEKAGAATTRTVERVKRAVE